MVQLTPKSYQTAQLRNLSPASNPPTDLMRGLIRGILR